MKPSIQEIKKNIILDKMYNYSEGTMTRKDFCIFKKSQGFSVIEKKVKDWPKIEKLEIDIKRNAFNIPFGNTSHPKTIEYNAKKELLKVGILKTIYTIEKENEPYASLITKTEFDFFNTL